MDFGRFYAVFFCSIKFLFYVRSLQWIGPITLHPMLYWLFEWLQKYTIRTGLHRTKNKKKMFKFHIKMRISYWRTSGVVKSYNFLHTTTYNYGTIIEYSILKPWLYPFINDLAAGIEIWNDSFGEDHNFFNLSNLPFWWLGTRLYFVFR